MLLPGIESIVLWMEDKHFYHGATFTYQEILKQKQTCTYACNITYYILHIDIYNLTLKITDIESEK